MKVLTAFEKVDGKYIKKTRNSKPEQSDKKGIRTAQSKAQILRASSCKGDENTDGAEGI